jgi:Cu/Ag efflux pump CusA
VFMGLLSISPLSISQFPEIVLPTVNVNVSFPGSSADALTQSTLILFWSFMWSKLIHFLNIRLLCLKIY